MNADDSSRASTSTTNERHAVGLFCLFPRVRRGASLRSCCCPRATPRHGGTRLRRCSVATSRRHDVTMNFVEIVESNAKKPLQTSTFDRSPPCFDVSTSMRPEESIHFLHFSIARTTVHPFARVVSRCPWQQLRRFWRVIFEVKPSNRRFRATAQCVSPSISEVDEPHGATNRSTFRSKKSLGALENCFTVMFRTLDLFHGVHAHAFSASIWSSIRGKTE